MISTTSSPLSGLVIAGVSCAGKDTLARALLESRPELRKVVTTTTRPPRDYEVHGQHYYFLSQEEFRKKIERDEFLEWAVVHGQNYYGLTRAEIDRVQRSGGIPLMILDVQGVRTIRFKLNVATVFVIAHLEDIERRLRMSRPAEEIASRMASIERELEEAHLFDLVVENSDGNFDEAIHTLLEFFDNVVHPRFHAPKDLLTQRIARARG